VASSAGNFKLSHASLWLIGLAWTLPFLQPYHRYPLTGFYSEWLALALGLAAAALLLRKECWQQASVPAVAFAPLALAAVIGVHGALGWSPYAGQTTTAVLYLLWTALMIVLGHVLRVQLAMPAIAATLSWFLLAGGVLTAVIGLLQHFQISIPFDFLVGRKVSAQIYGNLGQPNHAASYLVLGLVAVTYLHGVGRLRRVLATACLALLLLVLVLTGSRSAWLYLGVLCALALLLHHFRSDAVSRPFALLAPVLVAGYVVAHGVVALPFMSGVEGAGAPMDRLFDLATGVDARLQLWGEAWAMFQRSPLTGAGWGWYSWHHFLHSAAIPASAAPGLYNNAHNLVLHLMAETGLAGAAIVVGAAVVWIADFRRVEPDPEWWWALSLLGVIAMHSLLEYPLWYSYFLGIAALLLGAGARRLMRLRRAVASRIAIGTGILAGSLHLALFLAPYREFERLVFWPDAGRHASDVAFAKAIVALYREPLLVPYVELAIAFGAEVSEDALPEKLALLDRATHFAPVSVVAYRQAFLLALAGQRDAALSRFNRALSVYPDDAKSTVSQLRALVRQHPGKFEPLLELATARSAGSLHGSRYGHR
jgi:O-antigen ligase